VSHTKSLTGNQGRWASRHHAMPRDGRRGGDPTAGVVTPPRFWS
jgi:hypothetical protein